jgi:hypothetical protein
MSDAPPTHVGRSAWVGALNVADAANWEICKAKKLWGSGAGSAKGVRAGDDFYVWRSGKGGGWFARCRATSDARRPTTSDPAPWPDGREYKWIFNIEIVKEAGTPFNPGSSDGVQNITGILNVRLSQFPRLSPEQAKALAPLIGGVNPPPDPDTEELERENDAHEAEILQRPHLGPLERKALISARRGQGVFRDNLELIEKSCRVTGLRDLLHLRASHIKPWKLSDDREKVDGYNGLLLSPHIDHLFDRGWITFVDEGHLKASPNLDPMVFNTWRIEPDRNPPPFKIQQCEYLEFHREVVFKSKRLI